jgi:hypothetical protein
MAEDNKQLAVLPKPGELMTMAAHVAGVCKEIVGKTAITIQGRKYVKVEGWQAIAVAHGCFAGAGESERVYDDSGELIGWKANGYIRNGQGITIGTGEGFVGLDEVDRDGGQTWGSRAEYACRAMAQTRATSRAARSVFAHIVVMMNAGLETVPAEEVNEQTGQPESDRSGNKSTTEPIYDWRDVKVHWSKHKGKQLGELSSASLGWFQKWEPQPHNGRVSAADRRLRRALNISLGKEPPDIRPTEQPATDAKAEPTQAEIPLDAKKADANEPPA